MSIYSSYQQKGPRKELHITGQQQTTNTNYITAKQPTIRTIRQGQKNTEVEVEDVEKEVVEKVELDEDVE